MKKLLLSLALVASASFVASADTEVTFLGNDNTITYDGITNGNNINPLNSITKDGVKITFAKNTGSTAPAWYYILSDNTTNAAWRMYAKNTMKVEAPAGQTIKTVVFTLASNFGANQYANVIADKGSITPQVDKTNNPPTNGMVITWTAADAATADFTLTVPDDKTLTVNGKAPQFQVAKIVVTLSDGGSGPVAPSAPSITGPATFYGSTATVTISGQTGATIYYTMTYNGTPADPTTSSPEYQEEIVINNTATIKAIAVKDGLSSPVATATFTKGTATEVASIAEFLTLEKGTVCVFKNPVTVVGLYNKRYLFVQDETGGLQIFDSANKLDFTYKMGQTISGFSGTADVYNGTPQLSAKDFQSTFPTTATGTEQEITPAKIAATAEAIKANLNRYVVLSDQTITQEGNNYYAGTSGIQLYDRFSLKTLTADMVGQNKDIAGYAVMFNTTPEIFYTQIAAPNTLNVAGLDIDNVQIYGAQGYIVAPEGAEVYGMNGIRYNNANLAAGIYLVRYNGTTVKVVVK